MFGILHAIIIDCPSALIWTPFEPLEFIENNQKYSNKLNTLKPTEKENALQSVAWVTNFG